MIHYLLATVAKHDREGRSTKQSFNNCRVFLGKRSKEMKTRQKKTAAIIALVLALVLGLAACGGGSKASSGGSATSGGGGADATATADGKLTDFHLAGLNVSSSVDPVGIGVEKGWFEEEGLNIIDVGDVDVLQNVALLESGEIDAAMIMTSDVVAAVDNGANIIAVAVGPSSTEYQPHMAYVVLDDSTLQRGSDLATAHIGLTGANGCNSGFIYEYASQDGVEDPAGTLDIITSPEITLFESLRSGDIDIMGLHNPVEADIIERNYPDTRVLFTDFNIFGETGGDIAWCVRKDFAAENPDLVKAFVAGVARSNDYIDENPDDAKEFFRTIAKNGINEDIFAAKHYAVHGLVLPSHTNIWIKTLTEGKNFQPVKNPNWTFDDIATNEYNPFADQVDALDKAAILQG
jgi:NitT/TauT family transport system substrate-binding protein